MDIKQIKQIEVSEIYDFLSGLEDYGHIFLLDPKLLDKPFNKILEGIKEVQQMMDDSYGM